MKKTIMAVVATLGIATTALAGDLPSRKAAPQPPVFTQVSSPLSGWYVGVDAGATTGSNLSTNNNGRAVVGGRVGYEVNPFLRLEGDFTNRFGSNNVRSGQMVTGNVIPQFTIPGTAITPYALGGVGYGWGYYGGLNGGAQPLWNVGGGVRYALNKNWEVDARYRHVQGFNAYQVNVPNNASKPHDNIVTMGLNYKF